MHIYIYIRTHVYISIYTHIHIALTVGSSSAPRPLSKKEVQSKQRNIQFGPANAIASKAGTIFLCCMYPESTHFQGSVSQECQACAFACAEHNLDQMLQGNPKRSLFNAIGIGALAPA
jgi:hypothetical protein